ncbi:MAG: hypothetical protein P1P85_02455 [Patescibacteria group bacterium]|nr:hypothetical protein [Patescibacteria group bacterium]
MTTSGFSKDKIILLVFIVVGLLKVFGVPIWISIVFIFATVFLFWIYTKRSVIFPTPEISANPIRSRVVSWIKILWKKSETTLYFLAIVAVFLVIVMGFYSVFDVKHNTKGMEKFTDNRIESWRGYNYEGNCAIKNNALYILGDCTITRKTNKIYPWIAFDAEGTGFFNVDILDNNLPDYGYDNFTSGQIAPKTYKRNYLFRVDGDYYHMAIDGVLTENFGIAKGGRERRERTYRIKVNSATGMWIDNIDSK